MTRTSQGFPALLPGVERAIATSYDAANSLEMRSYLRNFRDPETILKVAANAVMDGDMVEAAKWWLCAAGDKNAYAIHQLGLCCLHGLGLPFNPFEAAEWFTKGAELEHPPSLDLLGMFYQVHP
jgi:TPR repeat protein